ncbi:hypothetical protein BG011_000009 [Mortierella polycephala]|uniref:F-box domain-containing protein n=1 Tax=Mortierella polycephala TaxID=41804 RepID=A0A9P6QKA3_9FUNG|nr:hypothetical protein BG011_000009 [Mortierella polycephala]
MADKVAVMMEALHDAYSKGALQRLKEVWVFHLSMAQLDGSMELFLSSLTGITTLKLHGYGLSLYLRRIMECCPNLEDLAIEQARSVTFVPPAVPDIYGIDQLWYLRTTKTDLMSWPVSKLRKLVVTGMALDMSILESLFQACPRLQALWMVQARIPLGVGNGDANGSKAATFDKDKFFALVARCCPDLAKFHFSMQDSKLSAEDLGAMRHQFLDMTHWSFADTETGPVLREGILKFASLDSLPNRLTTLELLPTRNSIEIKGDMLHEILCRSPHLQHLYAPKVIYYFEDLDVNDVLSHTGYYRKDTKRKSVSDNLDFALHAPTETGQYDLQTNGHQGRRRRRIWACRSLKTLHITVNGRTRDSNCVTNALVMFGYLSRVCPNLEELHLRRYLLTLTFLGGLCLLTRLRKLERFKIATNTYHNLNEKTLEWMRRYPSTEEVLKRPLAAYFVKQTIGAPLFRGPDADQNSDDNSVGIDDNSRISRRDDAPGTGDDEHDVDMSKVGLAQDLIDWMKERSSGQYPTWPNMDQFCVEYEEGYLPDTGRAASFLRRVRPEIDFQLVHKKYHQ